MHKCYLLLKKHEIRYIGVTFLFFTKSSPKQLYVLHNKGSTTYTYFRRGAYTFQQRKSKTEDEDLAHAS